METAVRLRKHTKFVLCDGHAHWREDGRIRTAEMFAEGGDGNYCEGGLCRCFPGTDIFVAEICDRELDYNWDRGVA